MPGFRDLLSRFRAAGAPGAPGAAGMPVDRRADVAVELEPVFAALAETTADCEQLRASSAAEAQRCLAEAGRRAAAIVAQAEGAVPAVRAQAMSRMRRRAEGDVAAAEERSRAAAEEITRRAAVRLPGLVGEVVTRVQRDVAALGQEHGVGVRPAP
jgi:hypothetical protein